MAGGGGGRGWPGPQTTPPPPGSLSNGLPWNDGGGRSTGSGLPPSPPRRDALEGRAPLVAVAGAVRQAVGGGWQSGWGAVTVGYTCHPSWRLASRGQWLGIGWAPWGGGGLPPSNAPPPPKKKATKALCQHPPLPNAGSHTAAAGHATSRGPFRRVYTPQHRRRTCEKEMRKQLCPAGATRWANPGRRLCLL